MLDVVIGLVPATAAAVWFFRLQAVSVIAFCVLGCVASEWLCNVIRKKENSLGDLSAVVTGLILAFSLPATAPWWMCLVGSAFAIVIAKMLFGGLGSNIFNPAMAARAFLTASFGMLMTTWTVPATVDAEMPQISATGAMAVTQATPLAWAKEAIKGKADIREVNALLKPAFWGNVGGCLGETSALALILGGVYLLIRRTITIHIPAAVLIAAFVFAEIFYLIDPDKYSIPFLQLFGGGMLLCAFFIATDPVTAPLTARGMWIFGAGVGALIMLIRFVGEYPEGVMYAVLLMNAVSPLIDRAFKWIPAGGEPHVKT
jgi:electron transport complex protein RnfD